MLQSYKNQLMRIIAHLFLVSSVLVVFLDRGGVQPGISWRAWDLGFSGLGVLWLLYRYPRSNYAGVFLVVTQLVINIASMPLYYYTLGKIATNVLFPLPVLWFFLLGRRHGLWAVGILLSATFLCLPAFGGNWEIYGPHGHFFVFSLVMVAIISYAIEGIREKQALRSQVITETDPLTGMANRSGFLIHLEESVNRGVPFYLVQMDLDEFRRVNLILGIIQADRVLVRVSQCLKAFGGILDPCRHYGDGFAWIFEHSSEQLQAVLMGIQEEIRAIPSRITGGMPLEATFGVTCFPEDARSGRELWAQGELALQKAKQLGRGQWRFFQPEDASAEREQAALLEALREELRNETLQVHFQPKICAERREVVGMEALVRWNHPQLGFIPPPRFIALAEQHGLIGRLGTLVLERSAAFAAQLQARGRSHVSISVNISPPQLLQPGFLEQVQGICRKYQVSPRGIFLEITESVLLQPEVRKTMSDLRSAGFRMSLDDFGTGYSSLSYLNQYPFDELKVDKSFTDGLLRSERERHVFRTLIQLSRGLGMHTVIEGVETREQLDLVRKLGATQIQGWYFAKAMPADQLLEYLERFDYAHYEDSE